MAAAAAAANTVVHNLDARQIAGARPQELDSQPSFVEGDEVKVLWSGAWWPGTVCLVDDLVNVRWDEDGSTSWVNEADVQKRSTTLWFKAPFPARVSVLPPAVANSRRAPAPTHGLSSVSEASASTGLLENASTRFGIEDEEDVSRMAETIKSQVKAAFRARGGHPMTISFQWTGKASSVV